MKRWIATVVAVALIGGCFCVSAEFGSVKTVLELSDNEFTQSEEINVTVRVTNQSKEKLAGGVKLFYPNGKRVTEFGEPVLDVGETAVWTGKWQVTKKQLEAGHITFKITYKERDDRGKVISRNLSFAKAILYTHPDVIVTRSVQITDEEKVEVVYRVENRGQKKVQNFTLLERIIDIETGETKTEKVTLPTITTGGTEEYTFLHTMGSNGLRVQDTFTYKISKTEYKGAIPMEDILAKVADVDEGEAEENAPANIILIVDGEVYPLTEEQKLQISEIIQ